MKKRTRDLKKHYRVVERKLRNFEVDFSNGSWYNLWHTHLDNDGFTNVSQKHRKIHILYYIEILEKIEKLTSNNEREFQTWILLDGYEGFSDAIYFHSKNPHTDFPIKFDKVIWSAKLPPMLDTLIDLSKFNIGKFKVDDENAYSYIIQKKGLGLSIQLE